MKVLLIFPTIFEAESFFKAANAKLSLGAKAILKRGAVSFCGLVAGYACEASKLRVQSLAENENFDFAILCGFCGACVENLSESSAIFDSDSEKLCALFSSLGLAKIRIASVEKVADYPKKLELAESGFGAVDMEAGLFKTIFDAEKFASFRVVSDSLNSKIPAEFFDMMIDRKTGDSKIKIFEIIKMILKKPSLFVDLISFARSAGNVKKNYERYLMERLLSSLNSLENI